VTIDSKAIAVIAASRVRIGQLWCHYRAIDDV
jgi:hypothetical protein